MERKQLIFMCYCSLQSFLFYLYIKFLLCVGGNFTLAIALSTRSENYSNKDSLQFLLLNYNIWFN